MGNIVGNNPKKWASNQVKLRQQLLGLQNKTPDVLTWSTNNTAWIRAISAVSISGSVKSEELTGSPNYTGGKLAKEFMLFSGTSALNETTDNITYKAIQKSGVLNTSWNKLDNINSSAYGFAGSAERGLVPMPGIISLDINTYNRGSLRNASLKIKAYNREQFAILDALFMHPGYSLLIEWGHTIYFKGSPAEPNYQLANFNTKAFQELNKFLDGNSDVEGSTSILRAITAERGNGSFKQTEADGVVGGTQGNYDGFYGKITNFVWSLNNDGSYDIEVKAISIGDIIESLTINQVSEPDNTISPPKKNDPVSNSPYYFNLTDNKEAYSRSVPSGTEKQYREYWAGEGGLIDSDKNGKFDQTTTEFVEYKSKYPSTINFFTLKRLPDTITPEPPLEDDILISGKDKTIFNRWLYNSYDYLKTNISKKGTKVKTTQGSKETIQTLNTYDSVEGDGYDGLIMVQPLVLLDKTDGSKVTGQISRLSKNAPYQYIRLKKILLYIQNHLMLYGANEEGNNSDPYIKFDLDGQNYMYTQPGQLSADPSVCVVPFVFPKPLSGNITEAASSGSLFPNKIDKNNVEEYWGEVLKGVNFNVKDSDYVADLLEIPVNIHYVAQTLKQATSNNAVKLLPFLESLMYGIQEALGSLNQFSVTYDHDSNMIVIRDDVPLDPDVATETTAEPPDRTFFNVTGYKPLDQNGSFITNVGVSTTLSNAFATMISIGAQSQSQSDISNATSLSKFNIGLIDSVTPSKISKAVASKQNTSKKDPLIIFNKTITNLNKKDSLLSHFYKNGKVPSGELVSSSRSQISAFNRYVATTDLKRKGGEKLPSSQGFIPFSMNLDMMGFSGLRIYEKFYITTEILPKSYPDTMSFLVKGLSHSVDSSGWKTKIDSLTVTNVDPENQKLPNIKNDLPNPYNP